MLGCFIRAISRQAASKAGDRSVGVGRWAACSRGGFLGDAVETLSCPRRAGGAFDFLGDDIQAQFLLECAGKEGPAHCVGLPRCGLADLRDGGALGAFEHLDHQRLLAVARATLRAGIGPILLPTGFGGGDRCFQFRIVGRERCG